jgi:serine/threonine-protein kinase RsbW
MATLAYAELDPATGALTYACAGHPPPLLVPASGPPRLLWDGRSTPLGSSFDCGPRGQATDLLGPADTILLYSDGLVERRDAGILQGLDDLVAVAGRATGGPPSHLVDRVLDAMLGDELEDDVCVLVVRRSARAETFRHTFPAAPSEVARVRRALTVWLDELELAPQRRRDVVLAVSEAAANAAEHAYAFDGEGIVEVEAWIEAGELHVTVRDAGRWRPRRSETDRGRGQMIMESLMRDVSVETGDRGTTVRMSTPVTEEVTV